MTLYFLICTLMLVFDYPNGNSTKYNMDYIDIANNDIAHVINTCAIYILFMIFTLFHAIFL